MALTPPLSLQYSVVTAAAQTNILTHLEGVWIFPALGLFLYYSSKKKKEVLVVDLLPLPEEVSLLQHCLSQVEGEVLATALLDTGRADEFVATLSKKGLSAAGGKNGIFIWFM